jgi:hypothetical protein
MTDLVAELRKRHDSVAFPFVPTTPIVGPTIFSQCADEIVRLRAERDAARRSVCEMSIQLGGVYRRIGGKTVEVTTPEGCAEIMRWDCFKEAVDE